jgi:hypothetical protein
MLGNSRPVYVAQLARTVRDNLDELTDRIAERGGRALPAVYGPEADPPFREEYRASVGEVTAMIAYLWLEDRSISPDDLEGLRTLGAHRAEQGISLIVLQRSIALAIDEGWNFIIEQAKRLPQCLELTDSVDWIHRDLFGFRERITAAVTAGHNEVVAGAATEVFADLLAGHDEPDVTSRAAALGLDLSIPHGVMLLIATADAGGRLARRRAALALARRIGAIPAGSGAMGYTVLLIPAPIGGEAWSDALEAARAVAGSEMTALVANPAVGPKLIHEAFDEAVSVVQIAHELSIGPIVHVNDLRPHRVLKGIPVAERQWFLQKTVGSILRCPTQRRMRLLDTLAAVRACGGQQKDAAELLEIDRETVRRRVRDIEQLTGREATDDELGLALYLLKMPHDAAL